MRTFTRWRRGQILGVFGAFLLVACQSASPTRPSVQGASIPRAPGGASETQRPRVTVASPRVPLLVALTPPGSEPQLVVGWNTRYVVRADEWRVAPQLMEGEIVAAARIGSRWLFASERGVVAASEGPDGPLHRLRDLPVRLQRGPVGRGFGQPGRTVVVRDPGTMVSAGRLPLVTRPPSQTLYLVDGRGVLSAHDFEGAVTQAVFTDADTGAVLLDSGAVHVTSDGGRTWATFPLPGDLALDLSLDGSTIEVGGGKRRHRVGSPDDRQGPLFADAPQTVGLRSLVRARSLVARGSASPDECPWPEQSTRILIEDASLLRIDLRTGEIRSAELGALPSAHCTPRPFGDRVAIACSYDGTVWLGLLDGGEAPLRALIGDGLPLERSGGIAVDPLGRFILVATGCDARSAPSDPSVWCAIDGSGARREVRLQANVHVPLGISGGALVGWRPTQSPSGERRRVPSVVDLASGQPIPVPALEPLRPPRDGLAVAPSGAVFAVSRAARAPRLWIGTTVEQLQERELPHGAEGAGFIDAVRGVAFGRSAAELWSTVDGGVTWQPLSAAIDGALEWVALNDWRPDQIPPVAECHASGCRLGRTLEARWDDRSAQAPALARAAEPAARPGPDLDDGAHHSFDVGAPACDAPELDPPHTTEERSPPREAALALLPGLVMRCSVPSADASSWSCQWTGEQVADFGLTAGRPFVLPLPRSRGGTPQGADDGFRLAGASEHGVVLQRNGNGDDQFVFMRAGNEVRWLEPLWDSPLSSPWRGSRRGSRPFLSAWLVDDTGAYSLFRTAGSHWLIVHHGHDGRVASLTQVVSHGHRPRLATRARRPGALAPSAIPGEHLFWAAGGAPPERIPIAWDRTVPWCTPGELAGRDTLLLSDPDVVTDEPGHTRTETGATVTIAWNAQDACVRQMRRAGWELVTSSGRPARWRIEPRGLIAEAQRDGRSAPRARHCPSTP